MTSKAKIRELARELVRQRFSLKPQEEEWAETIKFLARRKYINCDKLIEEAKAQKQKVRDTMNERLRRVSNK